MEKARRDRAPYDVWARKGILLTTPGRAIEYEFVAKELLNIFEDYDIQRINFDRHNMRFLKPWLEKAGMTPEQIERFNDFGQGFISMTPALRDLETMLLQKKIKHGNNPIMTMCFGNVQIESDAAGNRKFTKNKSTGRIDAAVSMAMAAAAMTSAPKIEVKEYKILFV